MFLHHNMAVIKDRYPELYMDLNQSNLANDTRILTGPLGLPTITAKVANREVYLHSYYDPLKEAERYIRGKEIESNSYVLVYGFGLGYHIEELLKQIGKEGHVEVIHFGTPLFKTALTARDITSVLKDPRVKLLITDDIKKHIALMSDCVRTLEDRKGQLLIHKNSVAVLPPKAAQVKAILDEWTVKVDSLTRLGPLVKENLQNNIANIDDFIPLSGLIGQCQGLPIFIVSAGPSLDSDKYLLKKAKDFGILISVGTALKALLEIGVEPDFTVITDPLPEISKQFDGIQSYTPLIFLASVSPIVLAAYGGPKIIAWNKGEPMAEKVAVSLKQPLVESGGSVATMALDLAVQMGGNPIILVGQDLAFRENRTHAQGTVYEAKRFEPGFGMTVDNNSGCPVVTTKNLNIYRRWIEAYIDRRNSGSNKINFINTALEGAQIKGTEIKSLSTTLITLERRENLLNNIRQKISLLSKGDCR